MIRKILISTFIVLGIVILAMAYFFLQKRTIKAPNPLSAISQDVALVLYSNNTAGILDKFLFENIFWDEFSTTSQFKNFQSKLVFIDSVIKGDELVKEWLDHNDIHIALFPTKRNTSATLVLIQTSSLRQIKQITQKIADLAGKKARTSVRSVRGVKITDVDFLEKSGINSFSFAFSNGLLLLSEDQTLLENSIELMDTENSVLNNEVFKRVYATAGKNVDANLFINFNNLSSLVSYYISDNKISALNAFANFSDWGEVDLHIRNDGLLLSGFSFSKPADANYLNVFLNQEPIRMTIDRLIPSDAAAFIALGFSNTEIFRRDYLDYLSFHNKLEAYNQKLGQMIQLYQTDVEAAFYELMDGEVAAVFHESGRAGDKTNTYLVFSTKSRSMALSALNSIIRQDAKNKNISEADYLKIYQVDNQTAFDIYEMPVNFIGELLFGDLFSGLETRYFTFIENYLVFGNSYESLTHFLRENVLNKTLQTDLAYRKFSELISNRNNAYFYLNVGGAKGILSSFLKGESRGMVTGDFETFRKIQAITLQFSSGRNMIYQNVYAGYKPYLANKPQTTWETSLDAAVNFKPYMVKNHNTGENELFVQDILNNIYLINRAGRILWKKKLPEPIISEIFQIDFYKNRKLQYLFNTRNFIYLVDRNGDFVEKFPVRLPSAATNSLAVFDYERSRDYRLFIAGEDKNIYAFSKEGERVKGWEFKGTENIVTVPVQHVTIGTRDYLLVADKFRIYILDRRGNHRVKVQSNFPKSERSPIVFEGKTARNDPRIAATDSLGNVWYVYFDGRVDSIQLGKYSSNHFFDYQDVDANGFRDFIFIDGNRLDVFRNNRSKLFSYQFVHPIELPPAYYQFGANDRKIGVVDRKDNQIYLFNGNGSIYRGFPLKGRSPFTIGYLRQPGGSFNLLVGSESNLLFNYTVN
jgi:hypothetical protein